MIKSMKILVAGRVQNVGFRYSARQTALSLNIHGYARNEGDGSVTIVAEGEEDKLNKFLEWCHQGPLWARVHHLDMQEQPVMNYKSFDIK
jgi:acylphosphatase